MSSFNFAKNNPLQKTIAITGLASISALGNSYEQIWESYKSKASALKYSSALDAWVGGLSDSTMHEVENIREENRNYQHLDPSVIYAIYCSRLATKQAGWQQKEDFGINIGSSRGATQLFEKYYSEFEKNGTSSTLASPSSTLGNISSWVAQDLQSNGPEISHSITCSTALHALLNGVAWLSSGMSDKFLVGGSEAALTPFTIAQINAMKIYAPSDPIDYPCRALDLNKHINTMVLGEGASSICIELGQKENALAYISGVGYATERLKHAVSISAEADCFQKSMKMALGEIPFSEVDAIVMHAPGTIAGDMTEYKAIQKTFGDDIPLLTTNKWKIGHTFGASGLLSLELAVMMLQMQKFIGVPFISHKIEEQSLNTILVNAVGFGGNAVSILLSKA